MKYVVVVPDGMGDHPLKELGGKTPLEAARTPNMDFFAKRGTAGLSRNIPKGFVPGTDVGCMSIFGYDPRRYFTGRGPLEAAELGIRLNKDELAFRCNLVTTEGEILKDFSAGHISTKEAGALLRFLDEKLRRAYRGRIRFYAGEGTGYRNLMIVKDGKREAEKAFCTPPHDIMGQPYKRFLPKGRSAGMLVRLMMRSRELFKDHPVNRRRAHEGKGEASMIWLWGQGFSPRLPSYAERFGLKGAVITAVDLVKGIAIHAGLDVIHVPGVTGFFDTNYAGKAEYAVRALRTRDFVMVHLESTDEAGHMGSAKFKVKAIQDVDRFVLGTLKRRLREEFEAYKIMVLPDHFTCVETRTHSSDPVPFLIYSNKEERKGPAKFSERTAAASGIVIQQGYRLMGMFISLSQGGRVRWMEAGPVGVHLTNMPVKLRHIGKGFGRRHPPDTVGSDSIRIRGKK
ncbi:MAG: cofactor-independent phosphoglycerate mutase [Candidatus Omnitrophica bacterium]|nr:cofactor-independent phosphoglycerate mutase [Candidatus Omnitrophota bacterium]